MLAQQNGEVQIAKICMFGGGVLKLTVAMRLIPLVWLLLFELMLPGVRLPQGEEMPRLVSPLPGEVLQGIVEIQFAVNGEVSAGYDLSYAYQDTLTPTWFLIAESQTVEGSSLKSSWDTSTISDGNYQLRLRVYFKDGTWQELFCEGLRIRNYSMIETNTPSPTPLLTGTPLPATPAMQVSATLPAPTALPANQARFDQARLMHSMKQGLLGVAILFLTIGIYGLLRRIGRRRN